MSTPFDECAVHHRLDSCTRGHWTLIVTTALSGASDMMRDAASVNIPLESGLRALKASGLSSLSNFRPVPPPLVASSFHRPERMASLIGSAEPSKVPEGQLFRQLHPSRRSTAVPSGSILFIHFLGRGFSNGVRLPRCQLRFLLFHPAITHRLVPAMRWHRHLVRIPSSEHFVARASPGSAGISR